MFTADEIISIEKEQLAAAALEIGPNEISRLVLWLSDKNDQLRYQSLLLLLKRSAVKDDVYPYFDVFREKLRSENSYQRSIGAMLMSANARWDANNLLDEALDDYLNLLKDDKPITVRQCIQALHDVVPLKTQLSDRIARRLMAVRISDLRATMQKLVLTDILSVLLLIRKQKPDDGIDGYIADALSGGLLDKKAKKQLGLC